MNIDDEPARRGCQRFSPLETKAKHWQNPVLGLVQCDHLPADTTPAHELTVTPPQYVLGFLFPSAYADPKAVGPWQVRPRC